MRSMFLYTVLSLTTTCALGGEDMPSVIKHEPATTAPCNNCAESSAPELICVEGRCGEQRLYSVETRERRRWRNRLFGGRVFRQYDRVIVRPVR